MYGSGFEALDELCAPSGSTFDSVEVRLNFIFDTFLRFFPFDSLGCVPENPCPDIRGVPFTECLVCRGTTVGAR